MSINQSLLKLCHVILSLSNEPVQKPNYSKSKSPNCKPDFMLSNTVFVPKRAVMPIPRQQSRVCGFPIRKSKEGHLSSNLLFLIRSMAIGDLLLFNFIIYFYNIFYSAFYNRGLVTLLITNYAFSLQWVWLWGLTADLKSDKG